MGVFSFRTDGICIARGWEGKGGGVLSEEPLESKYDAHSNWVRSDLIVIGKKRGVKMTRWTAPPFLAVS